MPDYETRATYAKLGSCQWEEGAASVRGEISWPASESIERRRGCRQESGVGRGAQMKANYVK